MVASGNSINRQRRCEKASTGRAFHLEVPWRLWNEHIAHYHYLGYAAMSGSQMRYNILAGGRLVALLSFGASAWKLKAREHFVRWSEAQRQQNLQLVVNNARFQILPWIQSKGLASKILAKAARQLPKGLARAPRISSRVA